MTYDEHCIVSNIPAVYCLLSTFYYSKSISFVANFKMVYTYFVSHSRSEFEREKGTLGPQARSPLRNRINKRSAGRSSEKTSVQSHRRIGEATLLPPLHPTEPPVHPADSKNLAELPKRDIGIVLSKWEATLPTAQPAVLHGAAGNYFQY